MDFSNSSRVHISYAKEDSEFAQALFTQLKNYNIQITLDYEDLTLYVGDVSALEGVGHLLILVSESSVNSREIMWKWQIANEKFITVFAILLEAISIPSNHTYYIDFDFYQDEQQAFIELLKNLQPYRAVEQLVETPKPPSLESNDSATIKSIGIETLRTAVELRHIGKLDEAEDYFLKALTEGKNDSVRVPAARALGELGIRSSILINFLKDRDVSIEVRKEVALALARVRSIDTLSALQMAALQDTSVSVRLYATVSLMLIESQSKVLNWLNNLASITTSSSLNEAISSLLLRIGEFIIDAPQHAFISYARGDAEQFAINLAEYLREKNFLIWIDTNLEPGTPVWMRAIEQAIQQAGVCIVIISPSIHYSEWVPREVAFAKQFGKPIIPIKYIETHKPLYLSTDQGLRDDLPFSDYPEKMPLLLIEALDKLINRTQ